MQLDIAAKRSSLRAAKAALESARTSIASPEEAQSGGAGTKRVAWGFGPRTPGFGSNPGSQGTNQALPGVRGPESEAQVFAILHKISRRRDYRAASAQVSAGSASTTDLLDAQSALTPAQLNFARARYAQAIASVSLSRAVGEP